MKVFAMKLLQIVALAGWLPAAMLLTGCGSVDPINPPQPFAFPGQAPAAVTTQVPGQPSPAIPGTPVVIPPVAVNPDIMTPHTSSGVLKVGDLIRVSLLDIPQPPPPIEIRIPADGKVTLPWTITVDARGKTVSQLQEEIRNAYVPKLFVRLTVNIKAEERWYYVGGEVRVPGKQPLSGEMTVLRAVDTVGGFTDFANRKKIELRRDNGDTHIINWEKARKNSKLDLPVYPNDHITVSRRFF
jgi:protein involved in polysaccharide export with SLBB domain